MIVKGQLLTKLLAANNAKEKERREQNRALNKGLNNRVFFNIKYQILFAY
jgi:hypothetical protein